MPQFISIGCVVLVLFGATESYLAGQGPSPKKMSAEKANLQPPSLAELGKLYQALELPLPPKEAFFVIASSFEHPLTSASFDRDIAYQIHFATGGPYPKAKFQVWWGFKEYPGKHFEVVFARPPRPETVFRYLKMNALPGPDHREGEGYRDLVFAIQCHLLQHFELSKFFYRRGQKRVNEPLNHGLIKLAWNYWAGELTNPKRDRAEVAPKLHSLVDKHGFLEILGIGVALNDETNRNLIEKHQDLLNRLDLTVKASHAKAGSVEAMIDELTDDPNAQEFGRSWLGAKVPEEDQTPTGKGQEEPGWKSTPDAETRLRNMGFAAIPSLIEHVDDKRLVRRPLRPFYYSSGGASSIVTLHSDDFPSVGLRVRLLLWAFFDLDYGKATKQDFQNRWKHLQLLTESDFIRKKLTNLQDLNYSLIDFASQKYTNETIKAYETLSLKETDIRFTWIFEVISHSDLPKAVKIDLLTRGALMRHGHVKWEALNELLEVDNAGFSKACVANLEKMTWNGDGESDDRQRARLVALAFRTEDQKARETIEKYVKGLTVNQSLAVLRELGSAGTRRSADLGTLSFLRTYLDDETVYQDPQKGEVGFKNLERRFEIREKRFANLDKRLGEVEVRNFAAAQILRHMGIDIPTDGNIFDQNWKKIREFAKDEVDRRLEDKKQQ